MRGGVTDGGGVTEEEEVGLESDAGRCSGEV